MPPPPDATIFKPWEPAWMEAWLQTTLATYQRQLKSIEPLKVEASHRRFYRLQLSSPTPAAQDEQTAQDHGHCSAVLMLSPPTLEQNVAFEALAKVFGDANIPVPDILATDHEQGVFLMTDLGRRSLEDCYKTSDSPELKRQAVESAISELHNLAQVRSPSIPAYTSDRLTMELGIFNEWVLEKLLDFQPLDQPFLAGTQVLLDAMASQPKGCVHRDYHCRNLIFDHVPDSPAHASGGAAALGIVDFQDALIGPGLYDIASLLRDCYYTFSEDEVDAWLDKFLDHASSFHTVSRQTVKRQFDLTALQRQLKAMGIFLRLALRDGKFSHLQYVAPLLQRVISLSAVYPELAGLTELLSRAQNDIVTRVDRLIAQTPTL